jgi:CheY-like chemotaxis protein
MTLPIAFIVDDDDDFREVLREVLHEEGYDVVEASNGAEAIAVLDTVTPDVMLIDLLMPVMNGWALFATVEGRPDLRSVPVVFLSAVPQMAPPGGSLILKKPLDLPGLTTLLNALRRAPASGEIAIKSAPRLPSEQAPRSVAKR